MRLNRNSAIAFLPFLLAMPFSWAPPVAMADDPNQDPVDILVLVDESASLSSAAVRAEKAALKEIIASDELEGRGIRVGVLPFSSGANSPRIVRDCELSFIGGNDDGRATLNTCADQIVRQRKRGSADTDFSSAISTALETFDRSDATKVILLLTDGKYDPDGNESISAEEQSQLDEVLEKANSEQVSMWALGFGRADKKALTDYVEKTSPGDETCPTRPEAVLVTEVDLAVELRRIIDHATCTGRDTGQANPDFKFAVSPLISRLQIEVSDRQGTVRLADAEVTNAVGEQVCADAEVEGGRWKCRVDVDGDDGGDWTVTSTKSTRTLDVLVTWTGSIEVMAANCVVDDGTKPATVIKVFRADGDEVDFNVEGDVKWPTVLVDISKDGESIRTAELELNAAEKSIRGIEEVPLGSEVKIGLTREKSDDRLVIRTTQVSNCTLTSSVAPTTTTATTVPPKGGTDVSPTTTLPVVSPSDPAGLPWWLYLLGLIFLGGVGYLVWQRRKSASFPEGSELARQNSVNRSVYEPVQEIGGQRTVYFDAIVDGQNVDVVVLGGKDGARYKLTRIDETAVQVESLYKHVVDDEADTSEIGDEYVDDRQAIVVENNQEFNARDADPSVAPDKNTALYLKVVVPEEFPEGDME